MKSNQTFFKISKIRKLFKKFKRCKNESNVFPKLIQPNNNKLYKRNLTPLNPNMTKDFSKLITSL